ncbi:DUF7261 family protein [Haloarcula onubensis]|uniref:Flagellin n=1 Tax=Haloarcula onubensis TaxID=2950539 RepID=A0ABU2FQE7_9EURY|nr:hypothetical protein [Halomicroarcula sp. S3CR25-11]MDS0282983.1 hypothetical protein [Halomicroarcula sp. S3CR25-11]
MAHLDDRGQIILVAAFALAVIFVAMALIVNSAIFTENLASRGETAGSEGALSMRADVAAGVGAGVEAANRNNHSSDSALTDAVRTSVGDISLQTGRQSARSGRVVDVAYQSSRSGERIYQSDGTAFSNETGTAAYVVAAGVSRVDGANGTRAFEIEADTISATDNSTAFEIRAQESGLTSGNENSWRARVWNVTGSDTVHVRTLKNDGGSTVVEDCEVTKDSPGPAVTIDVTGGTIDGEGCDALATAPDGESFHFSAGTGVGTTGSYDLSFANADKISGDFSLVVHDDGLLSLPSLGPSLESSPALYDVTVRYTHYTADLRYETDVRVAPGEPDV